MTTHCQRALILYRRRRFISHLLTYLLLQPYKSSRNKPSLTQPHWRRTCCGECFQCSLWCTRWSRRSMVNHTTYHTDSRCRQFSCQKLPLAHHRDDGHRWPEERVTTYRQLREKTVQIEGVSWELLLRHCRWSWIRFSAE